MISSTPTDVAAAIAAAVHEYRQQGDVGALLDRVKSLVREASPETLAAAAAPFVDLPEVVIPVYERIVETQPTQAQPMVVLANAYWLTGRGADLVGELAERARGVDPNNRGAWHLWALAESNPRARVERWQRVAEQFPADQLARAALADNAASLAGAEHDPLALDLAVRTYEGLWAEASRPAERQALEETIGKLRGWKL
ncbi:MAG TPA: hypothetical protein VGP25_04650 [Gemmatimonadaceae bacterium]|jgi:hypothetical protein|nr:hypothetical protein [Gemmatimonadaceae bacterium]